MANRAELKKGSQLRILDAAAARLRTEGMSGTAIAPVMKDAGLTHGAFYSHFRSKDHLAVAAFRHALKGNRVLWVSGRDERGWGRRLARLARRYLTRVHRDTPAEGCAFAAVASEAGRSPAAFRRVFEEEMARSVLAICGEDPGDDDASIDPARRDEAIALLALCVGGITLARAVESAATSERILTACRFAAARLAGPAPTG